MPAADTMYEQILGSLLDKLPGMRKLLMEQGQDAIHTLVRQLGDRRCG